MQYQGISSLNLPASTLCFLGCLQALSLGASRMQRAVSGTFTRLLQNSMSNLEGLTQHPAATGDSSLVMFVCMLAAYELCGSITVTACSLYWCTYPAWKPCQLDTAFLTYGSLPGKEAEAAADSAPLQRVQICCV